MADLGLMAGLAEGLKQGLGAYQDQRRYIEEQALKNRQIAMQEQQAGLAQKSYQSGLYKSGLIEKPEGGYGDRMATEDEKQGFLSTAKALAPTHPSPQLPQNVSVNQLKELTDNYMKGVSTIEGQQARGAAYQGLIDQKQETQNMNYHNKALAGIIKDKDTQRLLNDYQAIQTNLSNFEASGHSPQEFHSLQQVLRTRGGAAGGGVEERKDTYMKSYGLTEADWKQMWSNDPSDVAKLSPKLVQVVRDIAASELRSKQTQGQAQLESNKAGYEDFYTKPENEARAKAYNNAYNKKLKQFGLSSEEDQKKGLLPQGLMPTQTQNPIPNGMIRVQKEDGSIRTIPEANTKMADFQEQLKAGKIKVLGQ